MQTCIFQVYAPIVSWGLQAVGFERLSGISPTKSAIVGLIAAALGISREQQGKLDDLNNSLAIGVRVSRTGSSMKDYHTTQSPSSKKGVSWLTRKDELADSQNLNTILSSRQYYCDAYYLVSVWLKDKSFSLEEIASALRKPKFHLYFGRKALVPALPLNPQIVEAENMKEAFEKVDASGSFQIVLPIEENSKDWITNSFLSYSDIDQPSKGQGYLFFWDSAIKSGLKPLQKAVKYDESINKRSNSWQFTFRGELMGFLDREEG